MYDYEECFIEVMEVPLFEPFWLSRPDSLMLFRKLGVDFLSISELLYPVFRIRLRLIRARPNFYMISNNPNVSLGIVDC